MEHGTKKYIKQGKEDDQNKEKGKRNRNRSGFNEELKVSKKMVSRKNRIE